MNRRNNNSSAFTLIELLTVITIIAILSTIIISTVGSVRKRATQIQAMSTLRNVGFALTMYTDDNDGRFPGPLRGYQKPAAVNNFQLITYLNPYLDSNHASGNRQINRNYVSSAYLNWLESSPFGTPESVHLADVYVMFTQHIEPSGTYWPFGYPGTQETMRAEVFFGEVAPATAPMIWDAFDTAGSPKTSDFYGGRNVLYFDGRLEKVTGWKSTWNVR